MEPPSHGQGQRYNDTESSTANARRLSDHNEERTLQRACRPRMAWCRRPSRNHTPCASARCSMQPSRRSTCMPATTSGGVSSRKHGANATHTTAVWTSRLGHTFTHAPRPRNKNSLPGSCGVDASVFISPNAGLRGACALSRWCGGGVLVDVASLTLRSAVATAEPRPPLGALWSRVCVCMCTAAFFCVDRVRSTCRVVTALASTKRRHTKQDQAHAAHRLVATYPAQNTKACVA